MKICRGSYLVTCGIVPWIDSRGIGRSGRRQRSEGLGVAKTQDLIIVTADADFHELVTTYGPPPKVIWLRSWQYPTSVAEQLLRNNAVRVSEFVQDTEQGLLILTA